MCCFLVRGLWLEIMKIGMLLVWVFKSFIVVFVRFIFMWMVVVVILLVVR